MACKSNQTFLGLDLSTQQLKAVVVNDSLITLHETQIHFDNDLPEFRTHGGVHQQNELNIVTAPVLMWCKALDICLDKLRVCGVDFSKISAISGTAQQHGSVYWQIGGEKILTNLDSTRFLHEQMQNCFALNDSPTWMDSSTTEQCKKLEESVGGPEKLAEITGSRSYERFTGTQIAKIVQNKPEVYKNSERISLISSFLCSLFLGRIAPIDFSDGSGMNLMNIRTKEWDQTCLNYCGPDLAEKLGTPVPSNTNLGSVSQYCVERFGFSPDCKVIAFTGDNPASLIGMRLQEDWLAVSLGTSDTLFLWLTEPKIVLNGHILCNPLDSKSFMALLCFKNGSLTRERIRNARANKSWKTFNELLDRSPRGNFGNIGLYYDTQEIIPTLKGDYLFNKAGFKVSKFASDEIEVRALVEGQFIAKRAHVEDIGFNIGPKTKILATGGASANKSILQVLSDVFNAPVYTQETTNSGVLGAAYQAKRGLLGNDSSFEEITSSLPPPILVCQPFKDAAEIYSPMLIRYREIIEQFTK